MQAVTSGNSDLTILQPEALIPKSKDKTKSYYEKCVFKATSLLCDHIMNGHKPIDLVKGILSARSPKEMTPKSTIPRTPDGASSLEEDSGIFNERKWSKKIWKMYRMLIYLEKNKIEGAILEFSSKIRDIATYFAMKYRLHDVDVSALPNEFQPTNDSDLVSAYGTIPQNKSSPFTVSKLKNKLSTIEPRSESNIGISDMRRTYVPPKSNLAQQRTYENIQAIQDYQGADIEIKNFQTMAVERPKTFDPTKQGRVSRIRGRTQSSVTKSGSINSFALANKNINGVTAVKLMQAKDSFKSASVYAKPNGKNNINSNTGIRPVLWAKQRRQTSDIYKRKIQQPPSEFFTINVTHSKRLQSGGTFSHMGKLSVKSEQEQLQFDQSKDHYNTGNHNSYMNTPYFKPNINGVPAGHRTNIVSESTSQSQSLKSIPTFKEKSNMPKSIKPKLSNHMENKMQRPKIRSDVQASEVASKNNGMTDAMIQDMQSMYKRRGQPSQLQGPPRGNQQSEAQVMSGRLLAMGPISGLEDPYEQVSEKKHPRSQLFLDGQLPEAWKQSEAQTPDNTNNQDLDGEMNPSYQQAMNQQILSQKYQIKQMVTINNKGQRAVIKANRGYISKQNSSDRKFINGHFQPRSISENRAHQDKQFMSPRNKVAEQIQMINLIENTSQSHNTSVQ